MTYATQNDFTLTGIFYFQKNININYIIYIILHKDREYYITYMIYDEFINLIICSGYYFFNNCS